MASLPTPERKPLIHIIEESKLLLANDVLESINNIAKRIAEAALELKNLGPRKQKNVEYKYYK
jgi:hypothetical protein